MRKIVNLTEIGLMIDEITEQFLYTVKKTLERDIFSTRRIYMVQKAFGIVNQTDDEIYDQAGKRESLEIQIREKLINPILFRLFQAHGCDPHSALDSKINRRHMSVWRNVSKERYEKLYLYQMTFRGDAIRPNAIKYTHEGLFDKRFHRHSILINTIYIIDWNEQEQINDRTYPIKTNPRFAKKIQRISMLDLFNEYFSNEEYNLFIDKVRKAIMEANNVLGFDTIHILSPRYKYEIKKYIRSDLVSWDLQNKKYHYVVYDFNLRKEVINEKEMTPLLSNDFECTDMEKILNNCYFNNRYKAMFGFGEYAKCFITAEYLYSIFISEQYDIEYTAVACDYFKFLEQLIYQIVCIFLRTGTYKDHTIKAVPKKYKKIPRGPREELFKQQSEGTLQNDRVPFRAEYEKAFDKMLNPLIYFLEQSQDFWEVSNDARVYICNLLHNFADHCRNEHFHKDNIHNFNDIKIIRENTITISLLLLGALKIPSESSYNDLSIYDDKYDSLVEALLRTKTQLIYYLQFDQSIIMAHWHYQQSPIKVDNNGNLGLNTFTFIPLSDRNEIRIYSIEEYNLWYKTKERIEINSQHYPKKIWYERENSQHDRILLWSDE